MTVLEQLPERARVCVVRLRSLGDCVLTTPALDLLKATRPDVQLGVVVEDRFRAVFEDQPAVDKTIGAKWQEVRRFRPSLCLNLHGGTRSQWMTALSGAAWRVGFSHHTMTWAYNVRIRRAQQHFRGAAHGTYSRTSGIGGVCSGRASAAGAESPIRQRTIAARRQIRGTASVRFGAGKTMERRAFLRAGALPAVVEYRAGVSGEPRR